MSPSKPLLLSGLVFLFSWSSAFSQSSISEYRYFPPPKTHREQLSRVSVINQFFGQALYPSFGAEVELGHFGKTAIDLRVSGYANTSNRSAEMNLGIGAQFQYGAKASRLIAGLGQAFWLGHYFSRKGGSIDHRTPTPYLMVGYRYQTKFGFFAEFDAMLTYDFAYLGPKWYRELNRITRNPSPWAGIVIGYRLPSRERHEVWRNDSWDRQVRINAGSPSERSERTEVRQLYHELWADEIEIERRLGRHHVYVEGLGLSAWSVNYDHMIPIRKGMAPEVVLSTGVGHARWTSVRTGLGFGATINRFGGFLLLGVQFRPEYTANVEGYMGANFQVHVGKGVIIGTKIYAVFNRHALKHEVTAQKNGLYGIGGITIGYRPFKKYAYDQ